MHTRKVLFSLFLFAAASLAFPIQAFKVTAVSVSVSEPEYRGFCPHKFTFSGRITVNRPGIVRYTWERSTKMPGRIHSLIFRTAGSKTVKHTWQLGGKTMGTYRNRWARIKILAPTARVSNKAEFDLICLPQVRMVRKIYKVSGRVIAGGSHVDWLEGLRLRFKLVSNTRTLSTHTGTFTRDGICTYTLIVFNAPGHYRVIIEPLHPTDPDKFHLCFNSVDPAYIFVNLTKDAPEAINQNFRLNWSWRHLDTGQDAFDSPCW